MKYNGFCCTKAVQYCAHHQFLQKIIYRRASSGVNLFSAPDPSASVKKSIENYWRDKINLHKFDEKDTTKKRFYVLSMFPYPSGILHMGHVRIYTISDAIARFYRLNGYNVLHPMGWDAFGLPAENAAIEKQVDPAEWTEKNINLMRQQLDALNYFFDWEREFATCQPEYYKWTQDLFLKLFDRGLAYQKEAFVNWDPVDQTVLAEEQVDTGGRSWRSGAKVEKKLLKQWFIKTTPFAKSLLEGLNDASLKEWRDIIKLQKYWIGDCDGYSFEFKLVSDIPKYPKSINLWTNMPEFIEYAKYIVISPKSILNQEEHSRKINDGTRVLNANVINPYTEEKLPIFVTENVSFPRWRDTYLGIPAISMEDYKFSEEMGIQFQRHSIKSYEGQQNKISEVISKAREWNIGGYPVSSRLQDWPISRQRYWGTPIPIIHCQKCGVRPVPRDQLPVALPKTTLRCSAKKYTLLDNEDWLNTSCPTCGGHARREADTMDTFVDSSWYFLRYLDPQNTREMFSVDKAKLNFPVDLYIGGKEHALLHLYYARFISHFLHSEGLLPSQEPFKQLLVQGMIMGKTYQLGEGGKYLKKDEVEEVDGKCIEKATGAPIHVSWEKMSKSKCNGIDPNDLLEEYGIDTTRLLVLADVAPTSHRKWTADTVPGIRNWQNRLWYIVTQFIKLRENTTLQELLKKPTNVKFLEEDAYMFDSRNYFLKNVTFNITESQQISVAISRMQGLTNGLRKMSKECMAKSHQFERALVVQIIMLAPLAPHFASELWAGYCSAKHHLIDENEIKMDKDVLEQEWPRIDADYMMTLHIHVSCILYDLKVQVL
ncbi:hypothetical protein KM043_012251 [Ampulex compressa]|nr:hypothetical protein KM043_012251 [Ampulex compressa]